MKFRIDIDIENIQVYESWFSFDISDRILNRSVPDQLVFNPNENIKGNEFKFTISDTHWHKTELEKIEFKKTIETGYGLNLTLEKLTDLIKY